MPEALLNLSALQTYEREKADKASGSVAQLVALGGRIRAARHKSRFSEWSYAHPEAVEGLEARVLGPMWEELAALATEKRRFLDDALAREQYKEEVRLWVSTHGEQYAHIQSWCEDQASYLATKEAVASSEEASRHLARLDGCAQQKEDLLRGEVAEFGDLSRRIRSAEHVTELSTWRYPTASDVSALEVKVQSMLSRIDGQIERKRAVLEDGLGRERYAEESRLMARQHKTKYDELAGWAADEAKAFDAADNQIHTTPDSRFHISVLRAFETDLAATAATAVQRLKELGRKLLARRYASNLSRWQFETPEEVQQREQALKSAWSTLEAQVLGRKVVLDDHLARNEFKDKVGGWARIHADLCSQIAAWAAKKRTYLEAREAIHAPGEALLQQCSLTAFTAEMKDAAGKGMVAQLKRRGKSITEARYQTKHSSWAYDAPDAIAAAEEGIMGPLWTSLRDAAGNKQLYLDDALVRTRLVNRVTLLADRHQRRHGQLMAWASNREADLELVEDVRSIEAADVAIDLLEASVQEQSSMLSTAVEVPPCGGPFVAVVVCRCCVPLCLPSCGQTLRLEAKRWPAHSFGPICVKSIHRLPSPHLPT